MYFVTSEKSIEAGGIVSCVGEIQLLKYLLAGRGRKVNQQIQCEGINVRDWVDSLCRDLLEWCES